MIRKILSGSEANTLFEQECCQIHGRDMVPEYRCYELFGERIGWHLANRLTTGKDIEVVGNGKDRSFINFLSRESFLLVVHWHNCIVISDRLQNSKMEKFANEYDLLRKIKDEVEAAVEEVKAAKAKAKRTVARMARELFDAKMAS